jgi:hypothetical protein
VRFVFGNAAADLPTRWSDAELSPAQRLDKRQLKDDDAPFKGMVTFQPLAEDAGRP